MAVITMARHAARLLTPLVLTVILSWEAVSTEGQELPRQQDASQLISLLSSLATQAGAPDIPDLLHQVPGADSFLQQTGPAQFPSSMVNQLLGDYLPSQGLGQLLQGLGQYPQQQQQYPLQQGGANLVGALTAIAAYDDLQCVPRLLCEVAAGGRPGQSGKKDSLIPFLSKDTLITLLTIFNLGGTSPLLVFGRAVLLGVTAQGRPSACLSAYPTCPRDADQLVYYLNNHRGGFFQFFNNFNRPPVLRPYQSRIQNYVYGVKVAPTTPSPPTITAPPPPPPVHEEFPQHGQAFQREEPQYPGQGFHFPFKNGSPGATGLRKGKLLKFPFKEEQKKVYSSFSHGQGVSSSFPLTFPENEVDGSNIFDGDPGYSQRVEGFRTGKAVSFPTEPLGAPREPDGPPGVADGGVLAFPAAEDSGGGARPPMVFPDRTGTGELRLDTDEYGNPTVAVGSGPHVLSTSGQHGRGLRFPSVAEEEATSRAQRDADTSLDEHSNIASGTSVLFPLDRKS